MCRSVHSTRGWNILKVFLYLFESAGDSGEGRRRRERDKQTPNWARVQFRAQSHDPETMTWSETKSRTLNRLSHPGAWKTIWDEQLPSYQVGPRDSTAVPYHMGGSTVNGSKQWKHLGSSGIKVSGCCEICGQRGRVVSLFIIPYLSVCLWIHSVNSLASDLAI